MEKIKYISFYDMINGEGQNRVSSLAAVNKINYIVEGINEIGFSVDLISPSWTNDNKFYQSRNILITDKFSLLQPFTFPWFGFFKFINLLYSQFWLFIYLVFNTKKNENLIVYHSILLIWPLYFAKIIKKFNLILEVEEIYQDINKMSFINKLMEFKVINLADSYIFPTELLNEKLNNSNKPHIIIHGTYKVEKDLTNKFGDSKIHVVYAGTFDKKKGGADAAISAASYLNTNYHVHIIGFGSNAEIEDIKSRIEKTSKNSKATITYDGLLKGEDYIAFLQKCDIGLSSQIPGEKYNETSFPSKILSYMSNGLRVVSFRLKVLESSSISDEIIYYDEQSPESIAKTIMSIDFNELYDSRKLIKSLNKKFIIEMKDLLDY